MAAVGLAGLLLAIWLVGDASIIPYKPVVEGKAVTNAPALLASGLRAAEQARGGGWGGADYLGQESNFCYFVRETHGGAFSSYPYLACGGVFLDQQGNRYVTWVVPFSIAGGGNSGPGRVDGPVGEVALPAGTKLWRPDVLAGAISRAPNGGVEASFGYDFAILTLGSKVALSGFITDLLAIIVLVVSVLVSLLRRRPKKVFVPTTAPDLWAPVDALVFAPPVRPPRPVLLSAPAQPAPSPRKEPVSLASTAEADEGMAHAPPEPSVPLAATTPQVNVLGPVEHSGWSLAPSRRLVLELAAYLAVRRDRPVPAERLRTVLWPYEPGQPDVALARVHEHISRLRRCLGPDQLPEADGGYQLAVSRIGGV